MIPFTVIGGYLGAGKTTLLNHLLLHNESRRIALLINDFGEINIDASLIESRTDTQINLTNGCVCCTLSDGFHEAIEQLQHATPPPDHIIVEASGVADVKNLSQYGYGQNLELDGVLVVADAETVIDKANDKYVAQTVRRQLDAADLIILNKTDLIDETRKEEVLAWLRTNVPGAAIASAVRCDLPNELMLGGIHTEKNDKTTERQRHGHESYVSWSYQSDQPSSRKDIKKLLRNLPAEVIRAKGIIRLEEGGAVVVHVVGRRCDEKKVDGLSEPRTRLVALGLEGELDIRQLDDLAKKYLR